MPFTDMLRRVIELSTAIREYWETELPKRHPNYPIVGTEGDDDGPPPPESADLQSLFQTLGVAEVSSLLAIIDLGRKRWKPAELTDRARTFAAKMSDTEPWISRLMDDYSLAENLQNGLDLLSRKGVDIDTLLPVSA